MGQLSWQAVYDLVCAHQAIPGADVCAVAAADAESSRDPQSPPGDSGASWGLWMLNQHGGEGAGHTAAELQDPDLAASIMVPRFNATFREGQRRGYSGEQLARWTCMAAERPEGWGGEDAPGLDSPAADRYAASWHAAVAVLQSATDGVTYDSETAPIRQVLSWTCSVVTSTWCLRSIGQDVSAGDMQDRMVAAGLVNSDLGLLDGSGAALCGWLAHATGLPTDQRYPAAWEDVLALAGTVPIGLGGQRWGHWVAVRRLTDDGTLALMNPAPGWMGVDDTLTEQRFADLGPMAAVWIEVGEDQAVIAELQQQVADLSAQLAAEKSWGSSLLDDTLKPVAATLDTALAVKGTKGWGQVREARHSLRTNAGV